MCNICNDYMTEEMERIAAMKNYLCVECEQSAAKFIVGYFRPLCEACLTMELLGGATDSIWDMDRKKIVNWGEAGSKETFYKKALGIKKGKK